jgi:hypothetical protein
MDCTFTLYEKARNKRYSTFGYSGDIDPHSGY